MRAQNLMKVSNIGSYVSELPALEFQKLVKYSFVAQYSPQFSSDSFQTCTVCSY